MEKQNVDNDATMVNAKWKGSPNEKQQARQSVAVQNDH